MAQKLDPIKILFITTAIQIGTAPNKMKRTHHQKKCPIVTTIVAAPPSEDGAAPSLHQKQSKTQQQPKRNQWADGPSFGCLHAPSSCPKLLVSTAQVGFVVATQWRIWNNKSFTNKPMHFKKWTSLSRQDPTSSILIPKTGGKNPP